MQRRNGAMAFRLCSLFFLCSHSHNVAKMYAQSFQQCSFARLRLHFQTNVRCVSKSYQLQQQVHVAESQNGKIAQGKNDKE